MEKKAIPAEIRTLVQKSIAKFNQSLEGSAYQARYRGKCLYLDRSDSGLKTKVFRLTYTGDINGWSAAIYKWSDNKYDPDEWMFPGANELDGTVEGAMRAGIEAYPA